MDFPYVDILGYTASILVTASFAMSGEKRIRAVNMLGCIAFIAYASLIGSVSVMAANIALVVINFVKISRPGALAVTGKNGNACYSLASAALLAALWASGAMPPVEVFGFAASLVLVYGFTQDGEFRIRAVSASSSAMFVVYSILVQAGPLIVFNGILAGVHVYKLMRMINDGERVAGEQKEIA